VTSKARTLWAVLASLAAHASFLATLAPLHLVARTVQSPAEPPDVWTGDSIEVESRIEAAPGARSTEEAANAAEPAPAVERDTVTLTRAGSSDAPPGRAPAALAPASEAASVPMSPPRGARVHAMAANAPLHPAPRASRRAEPAKAPDPDEALARKILEYHPAVSLRPSSDSSTDVAASNAPAARAGGTSDTGAPRSFARAFTRAIPAASSGDPVWDRLALGAAGFVRVTVVIGEDGAIADVQVHGSPGLPAHLEHLAERTLALLRGGRFILTGARAGTETLRIDVSVSERDSEPLVLAFEPPTRTKPGRAYFQRPSGRVVEAKIAIE
jgi:hypothetical protein